MDRGKFLKTIGILGAGIAVLPEAVKALGNLPDEEEKQPVLFIGHGSPMNALEDNDFTKALAATGKKLKKPKAILMVSAHWLTRGSFVASSPNPQVIYDFGGFPKEMYSIKYPAKGSPETASLITELSAEFKKDENWGLDHGAWTVLMHMFPQAEIPVLQLSIDYTKKADHHYELISALKSLRQKGVLIIGSGNVTHNLGKFSYDVNAKVEDWALDFDTKVKNAVLSYDHHSMVHMENWGTVSKVAHPSNDHYLPLIYTIGLHEKNEKVTFIHEGFQHGTISMRCIQFG